MQVDKQVACPIISIGLNEMIGRAYDRPTTATNTRFFLFFVRAFDLLIAVGV